MTRSVSSKMAAQLKLAAIGVSLFAPIGFTSLAGAEDTAPSAATVSNDPLYKSVEDFWHFGKIARYDIATAKAQEILAASSEPVKVLVAFEAVSTARGDKLDEWLIRWQGADGIKDVATQLTKVINDGRFTRRADPKWIEANVKRLGDGDRAYINAMIQLRESGELAIPTLISYLRDPNQNALHGNIRRAILDLGRLGMNPLCAATEMDDYDTLPSVIQLIGKLGYDSAIPYLVRLTEGNAPQVVKDAAANSLKELGYTGGKSGDLFYDLGEKFYYGRASLVSDARFPTANVWNWDKSKGLSRTEVPPEIFNEVMALRSSEYALSGGTTKDALSLWLASNYKREAELPSGKTDGTYAGRPSAHYYGVTAGAQYLNAVLNRALTDRNSAVALAAVKSLQEIAGESNFKSAQFASTAGVAPAAAQSPLIDALQFGDRRVRYEAAFTIAGALPQSSFAGQEAVVPLLAEAIAQTGQPSVLVIFPTAEATNALVEPLKAAGFIAGGAQNSTGALSAAAALPATDVILISDDLPAPEVEALLGVISQSPKLRSAGKLFAVKSMATQWETRKASDPSITTTTATDAAGLKGAIETARVASGALPIDPELAKGYAIRSGELIKKLAISRGQVLDLVPAKQTLLGSLSDARPEIVKLAGEGLALLNAEDAQRGLADRSVADGVADDVKISLFKSLATNAKFFGNKLDVSQVTALDKVVIEAQSPDVKSAAAEARGSLNLPSDQAKNLILQSAKH